MIKIKGGSLIELLITLSIISMLITFGIYYNRTMHQKNMAAVASQQLYHGLQLAKTEAIKSKHIIGVCPSENGSSCSDNWHNPLIVFVSESSPLIVLYQITYYTAPLTVQCNLGLKQKAFYFAASSRAIYSGSCALYQPNEHTPVFKVIVSQSGRIRTEKHTV